MACKEKSVFTIDGVRKFHGWTHASLNLVLDHLSTIPANDYVKDVSGFGFRTLREQALHIFNCEGFWVHTLRGLRYSDRSPQECPSVADVRLLKKEVSQLTHAYLAQLTDGQLNADTQLHFPDGDTAVETPALVLHHVLTHAFHHKGQIVAMCRALGHPAPDTDLNRFK
jgi:uncharacterized damage-inducible protein DinB